MKGFISFLLGIVLFLNLSFVKAFEQLSLEEAISLALIHNPEIQSIYWDRLVSLSDYQLQKKRFVPQLALEMAGGIQQERSTAHEDTTLFRAYPTIEMMTPLGTQLKLITEAAAHDSHQSERNQKHNDQSLTVLIKQPLTKGLSPKVNQWPILNAQMNHEIALLNFKRTVETVVLQLISEFIDFQQMLNRQTLQKQYLSQAEHLFELLEAKYQDGRIAQNDLIPPKLQIKQAKQAILQSQIELKRKRKILFETIGIEDQGQWIDSKIKKKSFSQEGISFEQVISNDLALKSLEMNENRLKKEIEVIKDDQKLDVYLQGDVHLGRSHYHTYEKLFEYGYYHSLPFHNKGYTASVNVNIPLGRKPLYQHQLLVQKSAIEKNKLDILKRHQTLSAEYESLKDSLHIKNAQLALMKEEVDLAKLDYSSALEKYNSGRIAIIEVTRAKAQWHTLELNLTDAELMRQQLEMQLDWLAGCLLEKWNVKLH